LNHRTYSPLLLVFLMSLFSTEALATKNITEKYDGTVNSFRWLNRPIAVNHVQFRNAQEKQVGLSQFKGKIVLLNQWATWCLPCIKELPALDRLQQCLSKDNFEIVAVSLDDDINPDRSRYVQCRSTRSWDGSRKRAVVLRNNHETIFTNITTIFSNAGRGRAPVKRWNCVCRDHR